MIRRKRFWIAAAVVGAGAFCFAQSDPYPTLEENLAVFRVSNENSVADTLLAHLPLGTTPSRVTAFLDSLGYVHSEDRWDRRRSYHTFTRPRLNFIYAYAPYHESIFSANHFVCDRPELRLVFRFDETWHLAHVQTGTARGCI